MIKRFLYCLVWLYFLNPLVVAIWSVALQRAYTPDASVLFVLASTLVLGLSWYHIWMWVRVKNIELDTEVRKALGL